MTEDDRIAKLEAKIEFANMGRQVLNNGAFKAAMLERKTQIFNLFCSTGFEQVDEREEAWRTMMNMNALTDYLTTALETGNMAQVDLETINKQ